MRCYSEQEIISYVKEIRRKLPRYGCRKLQRKLKEDYGATIGRDHLFELLSKHGMLVKRRKKHIKTTYSRHCYAVEPNVYSKLSITAVGQAAVADITYIRVGAGFGYLFLLTDAYSRRIVGWVFSRRLKHEAAIDVLNEARESYNEIQGLVHHSDRGSQYCCHEFIKALKKRGLVSSMTDADPSAQNAIAERVNGILKDEFYLDNCFTTFRRAHQAIADAIAMYNGYRGHWSLDLKTPDEVHFESRPQREVKQNPIKKEMIFSSPMGEEKAPGLVAST